MSSDEILRRALELTDEERAALALRLMDSLTPPDTRNADEWVTLVERRARRTLAGEGGGSFEEAVQQIERDLKL
jgi:hypothetical protein